MSLLAQITAAHQSIHPVVKAGFDYAGIGLIFTSFIGWLGPLGALLAVVWYALQIYESKAVQDWLATRQRRQSVLAQARSQSGEVQEHATPASPSDAPHPDQ